MSDTALMPGVCYRDEFTAADYDEAIEALQNARDQRASMERGEYQGGCSVCGDSGHTVNSCHHDPLALARQWTKATAIYVCWHCGYIATNDDEAREHFGDSDQDAATCQRQADITAFAESILHGDEEHRAWLTEAAQMWIAERRVPPPRGGGTVAPSGRGQGEGGCLTKPLSSN